jgi:hypothetical protein
LVALGLSTRAGNIGMPQSDVDGVTFGTWKGLRPQSC